MKIAARHYAEVLALLQSFELLWNHYLQSDRKLFAQECRSEASRFIESFQELEKLDKTLSVPTEVLALTNQPRTEIFDALLSWAHGATDYPFNTTDGGRLIVFCCITDIKYLMLTRLGVKKPPILGFAMDSELYAAQATKWRGHLPPPLLRGAPDKLMEAASGRQTIVVVGDIRRSQDLMTYAISADDYSARMFAFINATRERIAAANGIFDKFTGDGFLAYFNEEICGDQDYRTCFLNFLAEESEFAVEHFKVWGDSIRMVPPVEIGLAVGADLGIVDFRNLDNHLVTVGNAIVWAARMATAALANEVLVNNLLFVTLKDHPHVQFKARNAQTKTGEAFLTRALTFSAPPPSVRPSLSSAVLSAVPPAGSDR